MLLSFFFFFLFFFSDFPVFLFCPSRENNKIEEIPPPSPLETDDRNRWRLSCPPGVSSLPTCLVFSIRSKIETEDSLVVTKSRLTCRVFFIRSRIETGDGRRLSGFSQGFLRHLRRYRGRLSSPHGVSSFHLCRLLCQINDRYRGRTLSGSSWRFLLLHVRVEDSVRVDGVSSVGDKFTTIDIFLLSIHECMW